MLHIASLARANTTGIVGLATILFASILYSWGQGFMNGGNSESVRLFVLAAQTYLLLVLVGCILVAYDIARASASRIRDIQAKGFAPTSPSWMIPYLMGNSRYRRSFYVAVGIYAVFYSLVTSVIVYQPSVNLAQTGNSIPSAYIIPCCGQALSTPFISVYLTDHLGILIVPATIILLASVSILVGLNSSIALFAYHSRAKAGGTGSLGVLGAAVGLFTGCPTCAGLFFANFLGGSAAVSFAGLLTYYQPLFILVSIPVLFATLYLVSSSLSKVYRDGCVYLKDA